VAAAQRKTATPGTRGTVDRFAEAGGWLWFSGIMLMVAGIMRLFDAICLNPPPHATMASGAERHPGLRGGLFQMLSMSSLST
jgi:hypothetical protein